MDSDAMPEVTAFVTGATGYTGRSVVALLRRRGVKTLARISVPSHLGRLLTPETSRRSEHELSAVHGMLLSWMQ